MAFTSVTFIFLFLPLFILGLFLMPAKGRLVFLFAASILFYAFGEPLCAGLMILSSLEAFLAARWMGRARRRLPVYLLSLCFHLGILGVYKYAGFICSIVGLPSPGIALPAGISFYTFQNLGYLTDVYRGKEPPADKYLPYAVYISFFPQLIAGPIENWRDIAPQLNALEKPDLKRLSVSFCPIIIGMSKKLLLADPMGQCWQYLSRDPAAGGFLGCWFAAVCYALQIYFDFSGYSDMAVGLGRLCGIRLSRNFDCPYGAGSASGFWRRWHITLSRWFRDYVYIPLGGSRSGKARTLLNLMITWSLTGLWHGAGWNFILWGALWGAALCVEKLLPRLPESRPGRIGYRAGLWVVILTGWVIFACTDPDHMAGMLRGMYLPETFLGADAGAYLRSFLPLAAAGLFLSLPAGRAFARRVGKKRFPREALLVILLVLCAAALAGNGFHPFLYFRF